MKWGVSENPALTSDQGSSESVLGLICFDRVANVLKLP